MHKNVDVGMKVAERLYGTGEKAVEREHGAGEKDKDRQFTAMQQANQASKPK